MVMKSQHTYNVFWGEKKAMLYNYMNTKKCMTRKNCEKLSFMKTIRKYLFILLYHVIHSFL